MSYFLGNEENQGLNLFHAEEFKNFGSFEDGS